MKQGKHYTKELVKGEGSYPGISDTDFPVSICGLEAYAEFTSK